MNKRLHIPARHTLALQPPGKSASCLSRRGERYSMEFANHGGHHEPHSPVKNSMCKRWDTPVIGHEIGLVLSRELKPFVHDHSLLLSSPPRIPEHLCGGEGGHMAVTVQRQFTSAVTERYPDACVGSAMENGTTILQFDLRQHDFHDELGTTATLCWRKDSYHVDVHELSTFHNPILYRFIVAQGSYLDGQKQRRYFTPEI